MLYDVLFRRENGNLRRQILLHSAIRTYLNMLFLFMNISFWADYPSLLIFNLLRGATHFYFSTVVIFTDVDFFF